MSSHGTLKNPIEYDDTVISCDDILIPGIHHNKYIFLNLKF